jgi:hypothetical protein
MKIFFLFLFTFLIAISTNIFSQPSPNNCSAGSDDGSFGQPDSTDVIDPTTGDTIRIPVVIPKDPNEIIGPKGYDSTIKWVSVKDNLPYKILFENDPDFATAPAQKVIIYMPIHPKLNPNALHIGDFGFGSFTFTVPPNTTAYTERLDVRDSLGILVDVTAGLDIVNRRAFWVFESIDPLTGLAASLPPNSGFLPVNDSVTGNGEGYVTLTIQPAFRAQTGDSISATADIIFDINEPLATNVEKNTIDAVAPVSKINSMSSVVDSVFTVSWVGNDDSLGAGVKDYSLYYSQNNGPFILYSESIDSNSVAFRGQRGATYSFYTLATDYTGNKEAAKTFGDQTVIVRSSLMKPDLGADTTIFKCAGDTVNLNRLYSLTGLTAEWNTSTDSAQVTPGVFTLMVSTSGGLRDTAIVTVSDYEKPNLGNDTTLMYCAGTTNISNVFNTSAYASAVWSTPHPESVDAGTYTLIVTSSLGCKDTAVVTVSVDAGQMITFYLDKDQDTYGNPNKTKQACSQPTGYVSNNTDCNDDDPLVHTPQLYYVDNDRDTYGSTTTQLLCSSTAPVGFSTNNTDCNDNDALVHTPILYYVDNDHDTYGSTATQLLCSSTAPVGFSTNNTDCNDNDALVHTPILYYVDNDHDTYGSTATQLLCSSTAPVGFSTNNADCNDNNDKIHPGVPEVCNGIDDNCNGPVDEGCTTVGIVSINSASVTEGNSGKKNMVFTISLDAPAVRNCSVKYKTVDITANGGSDYVAKNLTTVSFTIGQVSKSIIIQINGDLLLESDETFKVQLSEAADVVIGNQNGIGTIINDDNAPPVVSITSPANNATYIAPATIDLSATAADPDGSIKNVAFYRRTIVNNVRSAFTLLQVVKTSPYIYNWTNVLKGAYELITVATDDGGLKAASAIIKVSVAPTKAPIVKTTNPPTDSSFKAPATTDLGATATNTESRRMATTAKPTTTAPNFAGKNKLRVFPNPVTGELTVNWSSEYNGDASITIVDAIGKEMKRLSIKKDQVLYTNKVNVQSFTAGVYYLNIRTSKGESFTTRFVKE